MSTLISMDHEDRVALVTGAGRGIGRACAIALSAAGCRVALAARTLSDLEETAARCAGETLVVRADMSEPVDGMFDQVEASLGPVDILVANAGIAVSEPLVRLSDEDWQRMIDVNLTGPFRCVRRALPSMLARDWGRIVVMGSVASRQATPYIAGYVSTKHGALGLVRAAASEVAKTGVTVNAVCPGFVDSPMTDAAVARIVAKTGMPGAQARATLAGLNASGRLISPEEVAAAVMFCVNSPSVNGQGINVDGGTAQS
jgi:NAD(P)-dependent dehydrogenase (short-subunit alcohol dehydrogenase family)